MCMNQNKFREKAVVAAVCTWVSRGALVSSKKGSQSEADFGCASGVLL